MIVEASSPDLEPSPAMHLDLSKLYPEGRTNNSTCGCELVLVACRPDTGVGPQNVGGPQNVD